jgi:hypothetical protein
MRITNPNEGIGPPGRGVPAARAGNADGQGDEFRTIQPVIAWPPEHKRKAAEDEMRWARVCLSYEELREFLGR